jgi:mannose-1-phosphate guanylyltransferase/mannose-6-phosphate isomerase
MTHQSMRVFRASAPVRRVQPPISFNASGVTVDVSSHPLASAAVESAARVRVQPVILAGGSGTRLWPLSRQQFPKQLIELMGSESLLEATLRRLDGLDASAGTGHATQFDTAGELIVVCGSEHKLLTAQQIERNGRHARIVLEPCARNTAPALTLAAWAALAAVPDVDPVIVAMPADHAVSDLDAFQRTIATAIEHAAGGALVTLGIVPDKIETGYGYIKAGAALHGSGNSAIEAYALERFVEKPRREIAEQYLASGEYLWNSGIFVCRASVWLAAIEHFQPAIHEACIAAFERGLHQDDFTQLDVAAFEACPSDSIDFAVMERIAHEPGFPGVVVPLAAGWSDVGAWDAVWDMSEKDEDGNVARGRVLFEGSNDSFAHSDGRLVACVGVSGVVVVETADAILVASKDRVQEVKAMVGRLKAAKGAEAHDHRKVQRPWGFYDSIDQGERFQVKRIVVQPGQRLSLQMHHHRAEHWIVVCGTALVTRGEETFLVTENQSTYIPLGTTHRLENPGKTPLEMIEVQSGTYLGEDDIVRFDDQYGRVADKKKRKTDA